MSSGHIATCVCGFYATITVGGNRADYLENSPFPFYCKNCGLVSANTAIEPLVCPKCKTTEVLQYGKPPVSSVPKDKHVAPELRFRGILRGKPLPQVQTHDTYLLRFCLARRLEMAAWGALGPGLWSGPLNIARLIAEKMERPNSPEKIPNITMSNYSLAVARKRIASFVLPPLALLFGVATWVSASHGRWISAAAFLILIVYIGWLASNPTLRAALPQYEPNDFDGEELREMASIMVHVYYALVIGAITGSVSIGLRFYWIMLIAAVTWILAQMLGSIVMALISRSIK